MTRFIRDLRLIPIAVVASACLLILILADLILDGGWPAPESMPPAEATVIHVAPGVSRPSDKSGSWAQQMFNVPNGSGAPAAPTDLARLPAITPMRADKYADIITGSVESKSEQKGGAKPKGQMGEAAGKEGKPSAPGKDNKPGAAKEDPNPPPDGHVIVPDNRPMPSAAERALLGRLSERRQELDKRARELDIREGLIAEAEKRMEGKLSEIKEGEAQLATAAEKKDEAEIARFKGLVTMYENMKPRDAAKIFDRLEMSVLLEVASQIKPRTMSEIMAQMQPDTAERLTVELASRAKAAAKPGGELPKIEGRPTQ
ncbi:MAG: flagellar protein FlbB [Xanthobacteraceae bacterium]